MGPVLLHAGRGSHGSSDWRPLGWVPHAGSLSCRETWGWSLSTPVCISASLRESVKNTDFCCASPVESLACVRACVCVCVYVCVCYMLPGDCIFSPALARSQLLGTPEGGCWAGWVQGYVERGYRWVSSRAPDSQEWLVQKRSPKSGSGLGDLET